VIITHSTVIPTKVGTQTNALGAKYLGGRLVSWVPTFVGMTDFYFKEIVL
jgi:hypothetical protein